MQFIDLSWVKFDRWLATPEREERTTSGGKTLVYWFSLCDCGRSGWVAGLNLTSKGSKSCGCSRRDRWHTHAGNVSEKERQSHPLYELWWGILQRCYNPSHTAHHGYGGKRTAKCPAGIKICDRWHSFWSFVEDVPARPSPQHCLHRKDNDKDYEPGNVEWLRRKEHAMLHKKGQWIMVDGTWDSVKATGQRTAVSCDAFRKYMKIGFSAQEIANQFRNFPPTKGSHKGLFPQ